MASSNGVQQPQQQQQSQRFLDVPTDDYQCKDCGLTMNSLESLNVHCQYHKDNLLKQWALETSSSQSEETNNNTKANIKRESIPNNTLAAADSSESFQKKSPDYNTTSDTIFGHPPTPQSYQSANSPYQNHDNSNLSNFMVYQVKSERTSPAPLQQPQYQNNYSNYPEQQYFSIESGQGQQQFNQEPFVHKSAAYRYHPYTQPLSSPYDSQTQAQVSSSSPAYPPQPTPSPSPKQCDKCGCVCESASQLIEHLNMAHPPTPASHHPSYQPNQHFMFDQQHPAVKQEDASQSDILDLDSQKVVHNVYPDEEKRPNGEPNQHSMATMLGSWPSTQQQQQKMFQDQRLFGGADKLFQGNIPDSKMFQTDRKLFAPEPKMYQADQKLFQPHQMPNQEFLGNGVSSASQEAAGNGMNQPPQGYRPFEHMASAPNASVIPSTQVPSTPAQPPTTASQKGANWKSNEARRPKTYNCTACNKWFTSSGHLKRHYNTTLHKNAVKSSGQPDPANLPISAHHHPARESASKQDDRPQSGSSGDEIRGDDSSMSSQYERLNSMSGLLQQPPNGPYDRQPAPNIHHTPPLHSPMPHSPMALSPMPQHPSPLGNHLSNPHMSNGSSPNGDAGLSTTNLASRGLPLTSTPISSLTMPHGYNMPPQHMMPMEDNQYQMYPNELAPHVTQAMAINNLNTTGEYQFEIQPRLAEENQPLPGFDQIQMNRFGLGFETENVGGGEAVTPSFAYYPMPSDDADRGNTLYPCNDNDVYTLQGNPESPNSNVLYMNYPVSNNNNNNVNNNNIAGLNGTSQGLISMLSTFSESEITDLTKGVYDAMRNRISSKQKPSEEVAVKNEPEEEKKSPSPLVPSAAVNKNTQQQCIECGKSFNKACYLTQHNKTFHSGEKPFKCTRCGKRFPCDATYQEHLAKHAGNKPHKCEQCPKQFNHKTDLRRHMCLHTGQKPYTCNVCGKGFIRKDHMMKHGETHTRKTQSKVAAIR